MTLAAFVAPGAFDVAAVRSQPRAAPAPPQPAAAAAPARSPRNASYAIGVRLDPASRTLKGDELLTWRNVTANAARSLRFHL